LGENSPNLVALLSPDPHEADFVPAVSTQRPIQRARDEGVLALHERQVQRRRQLKAQGVVKFTFVRPCLTHSRGDVNLLFHFVCSPLPVNTSFLLNVMFLPHDAFSLFTAAYKRMSHICKYIQSLA
jgi:hypothetical protein